ncbi:small multidrug resistance family (SMR) protein, partial [Pseudomonas sp. FEN]
ARLLLPGHRHLRRSHRHRLHESGQGPEHAAPAAADHCRLCHRILDVDPGSAHGAGGRGLRGLGRDGDRDGQYRGAVPLRAEAGYPGDVGHGTDRARSRGDPAVLEDRRAL